MKTIPMFIITFLIVFTLVISVEYFSKLKVQPKDQVVNQVVVDGFVVTDMVSVSTHTVMDRISEIALNVAQSHTYVLGKFMCWDFSVALEKELLKNNYSAYIATGVVNCSTGYFDYDICERFGGVHHWVLLILNNKTIPIEATAGIIIPDDVYKSTYRQTDRTRIL